MSAAPATSVASVGRTRVPELVTASVLAVLALGPALGPGVVLAYDLAWSPDARLTPFALGIGAPAPRAVPSDAVATVLGAALTPSLAQKVVLVGVLVLAGSGAARLARALSPGLPSWAAAVAAAAAVWNPFVLERLVVGHWTVLLGYAATPYLAVEAVRCRERGGRRVLTLAAAVALCGVGGANTLVLALLAVVPVLLWPRPALRAALAVLAATGCAASAWAVPSLAGGVTSAALGAEVFAPRADTPFGTGLSLLAGGGFWNPATHPGERSSWVLAGAALVVVVLSLDAALRAARVAGRAVYVVPAALGLAGALIAVLDPFGAWTDLVSGVPGAGLLRDAQKLLAPLVVLSAAGTGILAARLGSARAARPAGAALAVLVALVPVVTLPSLAWGVGGRLVATDVPEDLRSAATLLSREVPGTAGLLPWGQYRRYAWNGDRVSLTLVPRMVAQHVLFDDSLPLTGGTVAGEDPAAARVSAAVAAGADPVEALRLEGVRYVVVERRAGGEPPGEAVPAGAQVLADGAHVLVLDLDPGAAADPVALGPARRVAWLVTAATLVAAAGWGTALGLRRVPAAWRRRRVLRGGGYPVVESAP